MNFQGILILSIVLFVGSAFSLRCYVCENESCDKLKDLQPQNCTREILKNVGPGIMNFTQVPHNAKIVDIEPPFDCQKVEATDRNGKLHVARRCQMRLVANQTCDHYTRAISREQEYKNASCAVCSIDACNEAHEVRVWSMLLIPTLVLSTVFMFLA